MYISWNFRDFVNITGYIIEKDSCNYPNMKGFPKLDLTSGRVSIIYPFKIQILLSNMNLKCNAFFITLLVYKS